MKFKYSGKDRAAKNVEGEIEGKSIAEARAMLARQGVRPLKLVPKKEAGADSSGGFSFMQSQKPNLIEFTAFIRQLATLQGAGIPIVKSFSILGEMADNRAFGGVLVNIQKSIEQGQTLTESLRKYPKVFDKIFLNLIAAGEVSGALDKVLLRLATFYEKAAQLKRKIVSAATYPVMILVLVIVVVGILLTFVVPTFASMFANSGKELPGPTIFIMKASDFLRSNILIILGIIGGSIYGALKAWGNDEARKVIDPIIMKVPIFGDLIRKIAIARFSRTLGTMIQSGVPIIDALEITANVAGNSAVQAVIKKTRISISEGNSISGPLSAGGVFPKMAVSMIAIGEQTGSLEAMLTKIAEFYEDEVDAKVTSLTSILEPLMIVIVGLVVAGVLIPMYLPIFKMGDTM